MPKIEIKKDDLYHLLQDTIEPNNLESLLESAKAEMDSISDDSFKIELNDTNRPDLWSCAGLARQLNQYRGKKTYHYQFFANTTPYKITVDPHLQQIRPYIIGFAVKNIPITEPLLLELIQNQEKFSLNFGNKRHDIAIGIYKLANIEFPVHYQAIDPEAISFTPLGEEKELNLHQILAQHPKGIEFGHIVKHHEKYPIIVDKNNHVLSFPPIINSKYIGEVEIGDSEIFIELTGFTLTNMLLVANIFACDLADRGGEIIPVEIKYPFNTATDSPLIIPHHFKDKFSVTFTELEKNVGFLPEKKDIQRCLNKMGYANINFEKEKFQVEIPPYRNDILHPVDIIEDYIIGKGYMNFPINMPSEFTIGSLSSLELRSDQLRDTVIGMGFQEVISNVLTSRDHVYRKMNIKDDCAIEIANPMTESYNVLQNSVIPSLLEIEAFSAKADYPHRIFEIGEVAIKDQNENHGCMTRLNLGLLGAHPKANFSEMRSYVDNILYYAGIQDFQLEALNLAFLIEGRCAKLLYQENMLGYFGEVAPEILENWDINMPCAIIEIFIENLNNHTSAKKRG